MSGRSRGANCGPVGTRGWRRSTRKVRQSRRSRSQASRYQRRPQPVWLGGPEAGGLAMVAVVEAQPLPVAAGERDHPQHLDVDRLVGGLHRHRHGVGRHGVDPTAQPRRQDLLQLGQGTDRGLLDPGHHAAAGGRAQSHGDGDGLLVVQQQRRQGRAGAEPVAAGDAPGRVHRVAEVAEPLHVAADGPGADGEPVGQLRARPVASGLQQ
jgi:hypothetical protein